MQFKCNKMKTDITVDCLSIKRGQKILILTRALRTCRDRLLFMKKFKT